MAVLSSLARVKRGSLRTGAVAAAAALALSAAPAYASPSATPAPSDKVDCVVYQSGKCTVTGVVYAMTRVGTTTYIGGAFDSVAKQAHANVAALDANGRLIGTWNTGTNGTVYALAASTSGDTVYIGGTFTSVNGTARSNLAAVSASTGELVPGFGTTADSTVRALATGPDNLLYVGGAFKNIGGHYRPKLAKVDQTSGAVDWTWKPAPNGNVRALTMTDDLSQLFAVGNFTAVNGQGRPGAVEISLSTGAPTSFAPSAGGSAIATDVSPSGRFFFSTSNNRTFAYDIGAGIDNNPEYIVRSSGDVQGIYASDTEVYVGGHFSSFPEVKVSRLHLASFHTADGSITAWDPNVNGNYGVWAIIPTTNGVAVGGDFTVVKGLARRGFARFLF